MKIFFWKKKNYIKLLLDYRWHMEVGRLPITHRPMDLGSFQVRFVTIFFSGIIIYVRKWEKVCSMKSMKIMTQRYLWNPFINWTNRNDPSLVTYPSIPHSSVILPLPRVPVRQYDCISSSRGGGGYFWSLQFSRLLSS